MVKQLSRSPGNSWKLGKKKEKIHLEVNCVRTCVCVDEREREIPFTNESVNVL